MGARCRLLRTLLFKVIGKHFEIDIDKQIRLIGKLDEMARAAKTLSSPKAIEVRFIFGLVDSTSISIQPQFNLNLKT